MREKNVSKMGMFEGSDEVCQVVFAYQGQQIVPGAH